MKNPLFLPTIQAFFIDVTHKFPIAYSYHPTSSTFPRYCPIPLPSHTWKNNFLVEVPPWSFSKFIIIPPSKSVEKSLHLVAQWSFVGVKVPSSLEVCLAKDHRLFLWNSFLIWALKKSRSLGFMELYYPVKDCSKPSKGSLSNNQQYSGKYS